MKTIHRGSFKGQMQKGFTLVELAIVLVIAGIILVAVLKGTDAINKAKVERAVADLRGLQGMVLETQKRVNRLPGDCNNDGVVNLSVPLTSTIGLTTSLVDKFVRDPLALSVCGVVTYPPGTINDLGDSTPTTPVAGPPTVAADNYNLVYNELRRAGVVDAHRTNEELARHGFGDYYLVSSMNNGAVPLQNANVIIMYGIPVWLAEAIDAEIDGVAANYANNGVTDGSACNGRVRRWDVNVTTPSNVFACVAGAYDDKAAAGDHLLSRDDLVSISYQFDTMKLQN